MTPLHVTLATLTAQLAEWMEDGTKPLPHAFEAASNGKVVSVLASCDLGSPVLFVLAKATALEDAVGAGYDSAMQELAAEYERGKAEGRREATYDAVPTEAVEWRPGSTP